MDWSALRERLLTPQQALAWATAAADAVDARLRTLPASLLQEISEKDGPRRVRALGRT